MLSASALPFNMMKYKISKQKNKKLLNEAEVGDLNIMDQKISKSDLGHGVFFRRQFS